jgi:uncharacterized protein with von Willebrand factor type A (vWA) domain
MPAYAGLPENLASFCTLLRREYGFRIGAGELLDAARALEIVDIASQPAVRAALRTVLAGTREDAAVFDEAFDRFFLSRRSRAEDQTLLLQREAERGTGGQAAARVPVSQTSATLADLEEGRGEGSGPMSPLEAGEDDADGAPLRGASYSVVGVDSSEAPQISRPDEAWVAAARALVRRVRLGPSRRWRAAPKGRRFDVRRTWRSSLQTGGELLAARWLAQPRRHPRFIVLIDGSRSMGAHASTALTIAAALTRATSRVEVFTFSTTLERVTTDVQRASIGRTIRFRPLASAWGGGTTIGACLAEFLHRYGERLLASSAVVIVASDGLDVGEEGTLKTAMGALRRRSGALIWLNPLIDTPGYEPTALGMRTARPFVSLFTSVNDAAGFARLSHSVRVRRH